ncbi:phosphotransferase family protein [Pseudoclavibacter sp. VKM Ac-2867]|uniref:phosphotransferase family protein n=1 Tax=Pseudoclavibacter sp. VKM Ac-2867 TaxID=2783829 RepID=UPI003A5BFFCD
MPETRFAGPGGPAVVEAVQVALDQVGRRSDPESWTIVEHGTSNVVALAGDVAVRVARSEMSGLEARRAQHVIDALPSLPFSVPRSVGAPVHVNGVLAIVQERIHGDVHPAGPADPAELAKLLEALRSVPLPPISAHLAVPRAYMGGNDWQSVLTSEVVPRLNRSVRGEALSRVESLAALESDPVSLCHGDLAGTNVLWRDGKIVGVLDWDLASPADITDDVASLASWHGWESLGPFIDDQTANRARTVAATHVLQPIAFTLLQERPPGELERAVARANTALAQELDVQTDVAVP